MIDYNPEQIDPAEASFLISELDDYLSGLYPPESNHLESVEDLSRDHVKMFGIRTEGDIAAIGAVKLMDGYGEIKRLYVSPGFRGMGFAEKIIGTLEAEAKRCSLEILRLETGIYQKEALSLFKKTGFSECGLFGSYQEDPNSVFMEKKLL